MVCGYVRITTSIKNAWMICFWLDGCMEQFENGIHPNHKGENPAGKEKGSQMHYSCKASRFDL